MINVWLQLKFVAEVQLSRPSSGSTDWTNDAIFQVQSKRLSSQEVSVGDFIRIDFSAIAWTTLSKALKVSLVSSLVLTIMQAIMPTSQSEMFCTMLHLVYLPSSSSSCRIYFLSTLETLMVGMQFLHSHDSYILKVLCRIVRIWFIIYGNFNGANVVEWCHLCDLILKRICFPLYFRIVTFCSW